MRDTGISTGYDDGTYRPLEPVKRDAMAAFLYRYNQNHEPLWPRTVTYQDIDGWVSFSNIVTGGGYTYRNSPYHHLSVGQSRVTSIEVPKNAGAFACSFGLDVDQNAAFRVSIKVDGREVFKRDINRADNVPVHLDVRGKSSVHISTTATRKINANSHSWGTIVFGNARFERE